MGGLSRAPSQELCLGGMLLHDTLAKQVIIPTNDVSYLSLRPLPLAKLLEVWGGSPTSWSHFLVYFLTDFSKPLSLNWPTGVDERAFSLRRPGQGVLTESHCHALRTPVGAPSQVKNPPLFGLDPPQTILTFCRKT